MNTTPPSDLSEQLAELKTRLESHGHVTVKREYTADMSQQTGRKRCIPSDKLRNWMIEAISRESSLSADEIRSRLPLAEHRHFYWLLSRLSPKAIETLLNKLKAHSVEDSGKNGATREIPPVSAQSSASRAFEPRRYPLLPQPDSGEP